MLRVYFFMDLFYLFINLKDRFVDRFIYIFIYIYISVYIERESKIFGLPTGEK